LQVALVVHIRQSTDGIIAQMRCVLLHCRYNAWKCILCNRIACDDINVKVVTATLCFGVLRQTAFVI